ncbi:helix-turn-helix transcriptional regulator [Nitrosomonas sp. ANs5]|uniref:helix-turn-helix transcriptional regulator n=1 Tax=Nitrosomonas sp. ANs5 TaxID=3423941 RepID=UPI003D338F0C
MSKLIRVREVMQLTSLSRASIYARLNPNSPYFDVSFPRQAKLSPGSRGVAAWSLCEIEDWVRAQLEARPAQKH